jgi:hypothetical protein
MEALARRTPPALPAGDAHAFQKGKSLRNVKWIALAAAAALPLLGASAPAAHAQPIEVVPPSGCNIVTDASGDGGYSLTDNGDGAQVTTTRTSDCWTFNTADAVKISGVLYYQISDSLHGYCLEEASSKVYADPCNADQPDDQLWALAGASYDELQNAANGYLSAASIASGADVDTVSSGTATTEDQVIYSDPSADMHVLPTYYAPYPGYNGTGFPTLEEATPYGTVSDAVIVVCTDGDPNECGGSANEKNDDWATTIDDLESAGVTPLYYISTDDDPGSSPYTLSDIETDISNAISWYGTGIGFMFDQESTVASDISYYQDIYNYVVTTEGLTTPVMFNPGTTLSSGAWQFGPQVIQQVFEGTQATFQGTKFQSWMSDYPASEFSATLTLNGAKSQDDTDIGDAQADNIGNFYLDDELEGTNGPPYDTLPSFLSAEIADTAPLTSPVPG